ncbi:unnamed protein product [Pleuronectes platessa]|uniref:Uncharacterized protein n=1 Tax=Pleuronectes platessa TaxID=8262 RepID=A0A9N7TPZ9_PLEPL|nr:unnamed protein product [Pleuronectes platessa]
MQGKRGGSGPDGGYTAPRWTNLNTEEACRGQRVCDQDTDAAALTPRLSRDPTPHSVLIHTQIPHSSVISCFSTLPLASTTLRSADKLHRGQTQWTDFPANSITIELQCIAATPRPPAIFIWPPRSLPRSLGSHSPLHTLNDEALDLLTGEADATSNERLDGDVAQLMEFKEAVDGKTGCLESAEAPRLPPDGATSKSRTSLCQRSLDLRSPQGAAGIVTGGGSLSQRALTAPCGGRGSGV